MYLFIISFFKKLFISYLLFKLFRDGTTDTTRVTHFGEPTKEEIDCYTRVLLGNLDVERVNFPAGKKYSGADVDVLARRHLWEVKLVLNEN